MIITIYDTSFKHNMQGQIMALRVLPFSFQIAVQ